MHRKWIAAVAPLLPLVLVLLLARLPGDAAASTAPPPAPRQVITQTVVLTPSRDNTLYETELGTISNGAGDHFFAGMTQNTLIRRGLLAFDLSGIPANATVLTATLTLTMSKTIHGAADVGLHALAADWGAASSDALGEEGAGATALPGDATWLHAFFDTDTWTQPGGDFAAAPAAVTTVDNPGVYSWSSPGLLADVTAWVGDPATNFGWALLGDETTNGTAKRFDSMENEPANRPRLTITYAAEEVEAFEAFLALIIGE